MYAEVAWVLVSLGTKVQIQIAPDPDFLTKYLCVSYDYEEINPGHDICGSIKIARLCC